MSEYYSRRNLDFLLKEVFDLESLLKLDYYKKHDLDGVKMILDAAGQLADTEMRPFNEEMDRKDPQLEGGKVKVHSQIKKLLKKFGEGGWISANANEEVGGQQLPILVSSCAQFIFGAANYSASVYPFLTAGAARLIEEHGSDQLKDTYVPKLYSGAWQGTMAMTEPDAGSSLSDVSTSAEPLDDNGTVFSIQGQKIFISAGDHDAVDNVVHLMLARVKGAPEGTKGLSLFVVPQKRFTEDNQEVMNDVTTTGLYHKMGYKAAPIVHLSFGEKKRCFGYLIGKQNEGLSYMFQMMNEARIGVGLSASSIGSAAYYASLNYAKERPQGRKPDEKDPNSPQVNIIEHSDVRRMLFFQKAIVEGSLSLLLQCAHYADMAKAGKEEIKEIYRLTLDLLTPVAKSYPSEMGILSTSAAIQILGGAGYCKDFPLEQYFREMRIHTIHEGTTGIHGIDLLGRKIIMGGGIAFRAFTEEVSKTIKKVKLEVIELSKYGEKLNDALFRLQNITMKLSTIAMKEKKEVFLMDATLYLELFGVVAIGWQWLLQAIPCQIAVNENRGDEFYNSKLHTMRYYFEYELPKTEAIIAKLNSSDRMLIEIDSKDII
ncbi:acyl-CoA dehydrogenase [Reichenbachiella sp.]|uniref:acyl-CoA dehydrogenase n=1 Tax=Reichenbachiella sp. TaxID=2184521 RepID=UPI003B5BF893